MLSPLRIAAVALLLVTACKKDAPRVAKVDAEGSPEAVYRAYMFANLEGTEEKIRPLIVDRPGSEVLFQGPYPEAAATKLAAQYRTMEIVRVAETPERVTLKSSGAPVPFDMLLQGNEWRLDPTPIISFRQKAGQR